MGVGVAVCWWVCVCVFESWGKRGVGVWKSGGGHHWLMSRHGCVGSEKAPTTCLKLTWCMRCNIQGQAQPWSSAGIISSDDCSLDHALKRFSGWLSLGHALQKSSGGLSLGHALQHRAALHWWAHGPMGLPALAMSGCLNRDLGICMHRARSLCVHALCTTGLNQYFDWLALSGSCGTIRC